MEQFRILSLDGGGVRGAFAASFLQYVEEQIEQPIGAYFDLIVGTSTGGILALGAGTRIPMTVMRELYETKAASIFRPRIFRRGYLQSRFSPKPLSIELQSLFGEKLLAHSASRLCIPATEAITGSPKVFKTAHHEGYRVDHLLPMWKIGMATSAAPMYFPAFPINEFQYVDGGLWANNPAVVGIAEAVKLGVAQLDIRMLSIGTGACVFQASKKAIRTGGIARWGKSIVELTMLCQGQGAHFATRYLCEGTNVQRIEESLPGAKPNQFGLASVGGVPDLIAYGRKKAEIHFDSLRDTFFTTEAAQPKFFDKREETRIL